jgi:tRNA(Ile2) C34 agmatinyltransferase TiaS
MRIYVGFDDTDTIAADRGTGKLARWFEDVLPEGCKMEGVVRQQLLVDERIPYTSHNSSACVVVHAPDSSWLALLTARAIEHVKRHSLEGSDPGLCVASEDANALAGLIAFGRACTSRVVSQQEALAAASGSHLSGHGGTNDGIIGAAAAVGLTASGWSGRFIEYGKLRRFTDPVRVSELERSNILVVSSDRDARVPAPEDIVHTKGWLRPRLWGKRAVLLVTPRDEGVWESLGERRNKAKESAAATQPAS